MSAPKKIKYKAVYCDPKANPFTRYVWTFSKTVEIDSAVPRSQVEAWAREAQGTHKFVRLENA